MEYTELSPKGNFESWSEDKLAELQQKNISDSLGTCLFENDALKVSELVLSPFERIPFIKQKYTYSATCLAEGMVISRNGNGQITLLRVKKGDISIWKVNGLAVIRDLQNIGPTTIKAIITEYKNLSNFTDSEKRDIQQ
ncbi:hypothetical protein FGM00_03725 [Aggregatimonas sangjinii]|uniref:Uncharacterized protein n=1 Tax=Aggregatimonas sangjinii TaxID=2583587 RepID=A0A5B7SMD1_9FLAO|nr:hypothetical protein [Aggregatimonas sangjinii]QCW99261.1 hypothetical protein FGM00_03725 [Aggregatimonas sangjinii]